jgi:hypothetical protein
MTSKQSFNKIADAATASEEVVNYQKESDAWS